MNVWVPVLAAAAAIAGFFAWENRRTAKAHARFTPKDVEAALAELLDLAARDHDAWDLFLTWPINDSYLESIRLECLTICRECPPVPGKDIDDEGERRVAALLADLRHRTGTGGGIADAPAV